MAKQSYSRLMYFVSETHDFQKQQSVVVVNLVGPLVRENEAILQECIDGLGRSQARWLIFNFRDVPFESLSPGKYSITCRIEQNLLSPGLYLLSVGARCASKYLDYVPQAMTFEIYSDDTVASLWLDDVQGCVRVPSEWTQPVSIAELASA